MAVRDVIQSAAGSAGDSKTYIEDVFSTYLYTGNGSTQTINNGIDLAGKGGLVWCKARSAATLNVLLTSIFPDQYLTSGSTGALGNAPGWSLGSTGFTLPSTSTLNGTGVTFSSWTFRKAPKFFDVVTYTGVGYNRTVPHSLGSIPGMVIVKATSGTATNWYVYHRGLTSSAYYANLNTTSAETADASVWSGVDPTSTDLYIGANAGVNTNGVSYVAYLFAHDTTTDGLIQCGSYTGNSSTAGPTVTLGWEPQYVMVKNATGATGWRVIDNMRGMAVTSNSMLEPNTSAAEVAVTPSAITPNATGFQITNTGAGYNSSGSTYIYMAIRRGPMKTPTDGTKVFMPSTADDGSVITTGFPVDTSFEAYRPGHQYNTIISNRLTASKALVTSSTASEITAGFPSAMYQNNTGIFPAFFGNSNVTWNFRRAPGFFDVVCYTGNDTTQSLSHNLTVAPELVIVKSRNGTGFWRTLSTSLSQYTNLNTTGAFTSSSIQLVFGNNTSYIAPTSTQFTVGNDDGVNNGGGTYVAYLFASCPGVSKVGSYTGDGNTGRTINCGFTNGARFVMIKRTDSTGDWYVWDSARGIVAAADPRLSLNTTSVEVTSEDSIDPTPSGFIINTGTVSINTFNATYIYLAIA